jgi:hypothetical protein
MGARCAAVAPRRALARRQRVPAADHLAAEDESRRWRPLVERHLAIDIAGVGGIEQLGTVTDAYLEKRAAPYRQDRLLRQLVDGLVAFTGAMGEAWRDTTVVVMTEFGRTARPNGTRGTDHGTAGVGFVLGARVGRSRVVSDWPGLGERALYEGRDVAPTLDTRAVLRDVIAARFDLTAAQVERVLPGAGGCGGCSSGGASGRRRAAADGSQRVPSVHRQLRPRDVSRLV